MKYGDRLEWEGVCRTQAGVIVKSGNGEPLVKMEDGKFFRLKDVKNSKSLKVIKA